MIWKPYSELATAAHSVVGDLRVHTGLASPQLGNRRDLFAYLPPSYTTDAARRYPVLYMQDGQNLFDVATSFAGEWCADETMEALAAEGIEAILIGVPNTGATRLDEYSPFRDARHGGGQGDSYLRFLADTVKPLVDGSLRTLPDRAHSGIIGSSMGGLISLYAFFAYPEQFGLVGALSPSLWFARGRVMTTIRRCPPILGKIYMDCGSAEGARTANDISWISTLLARSTTMDGELYELLLQKGYRPERDIRYVVEEDAGHNEAAWARRLPDALRFLLADLV